MSENPYRASLKDFRTGDRVVFTVSPDISESINVQYSTTTPIHMPGSIVTYQSTASRKFSLSNVKLISASRQQVSDNMMLLQQLKAWCMPRFGRNGDFIRTLENEGISSVGIDDIKNQLPGPRSDKSPKDLIKSQKQAGIESNNAKIAGSNRLKGMPPPILLFNAYSVSDRIDIIQNIRDIPVLIESVNFIYPSDIDYVPSKDGVPFPTIMTLGIELLETHSPRELEINFDLDKYRNGTLRYF